MSLSPVGWAASDPVGNGVGWAVRLGLCLDVPLSGVCVCLCSPGPSRQPLCADGSGSGLLSISRDTSMRRCYHLTCSHRRCREGAARVPALPVWRPRQRERVTSWLEVMELKAAETAREPKPLGAPCVGDTQARGPRPSVSRRTWELPPCPGPLLQAFPQSPTTTGAHSSGSKSLDPAIHGAPQAPAPPPPDWISSSSHQLQSKTPAQASCPPSLSISPLGLITPQACKRAVISHLKNHSNLP